MKNEIFSIHSKNAINGYDKLPGLKNSKFQGINSKESKLNSISEHIHDLNEILFITSYPPRECGIATYSEDLIKAINNKFSHSLTIKVCALESNGTTFDYPEEVKYILKTSVANEYQKLAFKINQDKSIIIVLIQHEFGFYRMQEREFLQFLHQLSKPVVVVFHTVLPYPDEQFKLKVQHIAAACTSIVVMTKTSANILQDTYDIPLQKISVIPHGTHLVPHVSKGLLKKKYGLKGRKILTTFGLLSSGKNIETALEAGMQNSVPSTATR